MSSSMNDKMKCLGCNKDKPKSDFGTTGNARALCKSCRSGRVVSTSKGRGHRSSDGSWIGDVIGAVLDGIDFFN